jgi:hypothetical protein
MMPANTPQDTPQSTTFVRSQTFKDIYANGLRIRITPIDCVITLARTLDIPGAQQVVQDEASIAMPLAFAKIFLLHLQQALEAVENVLGTIPVPEPNMPKEDFKHAIIESLKAVKMIR